VFSRKLIKAFLEWARETDAFVEPFRTCLNGIDATMFTFVRTLPDFKAALAVATQISEYGSSGSFHATSSFGKLDDTLHEVNANSQKMALRDVCC
jgi:hypothetical protein